MIMRRSQCLLRLVYPFLFSLYCNDMPDVDDSKEGEIYMYVDDATLYAIAPNHNLEKMLINTHQEKMLLPK